MATAFSSKLFQTEFPTTAASRRGLGNLLDPVTGERITEHLFCFFSYTKDLQHFNSTLLASGNTLISHVLPVLLPRPATTDADPITACTAGGYS